MMMSTTMDTGERARCSRSEQLTSPAHTAPTNGPGSHPISLSGAGRFPRGSAERHISRRRSQCTVCECRSGAANHSTIGQDGIKRVESSRLFTRIFPHSFAHSRTICLCGLGPASLNMRPAPDFICRPSLSVCASFPAHGRLSSHWPASIRIAWPPRPLPVRAWLLLTVLPHARSTMGRRRCDGSTADRRCQFCGVATVNRGTPVSNIIQTTASIACRLATRASERHAMNVKKGIMQTPLDHIFPAPSLRSVEYSVEKAATRKLAN